MNVANTEYRYPSHNKTPTLDLFLVLSNFYFTFLGGMFGAYETDCWEDQFSWSRHQHSSSTIHVQSGTSWCYTAQIQRYPTVPCKILWPSVLFSTIAHQIFRVLLVVSSFLLRVSFSCIFRSWFFPPLCVA